MIISLPLVVEIVPVCLYILLASAIYPPVRSADKYDSSIYSVVVRELMLVSQRDGSVSLSRFSIIWWQNCFMQPASYADMLVTDPSRYQSQQGTLFE